MIKAAKRLAIATVAAIVLATTATAWAVDVYQQFNDEDIKPYIKIIKGPWINNTVTGGPGNYQLTVKMPKDEKYVLGLFDNKINRAGKDARSAVVLFDGVNPLAPTEKIPVEEIESADVSYMRKYGFDGLTFNSRDTSGKDCCLKVVDAKEEYEFGEVKPFTVPSGRSRVLGRIDVFIYAAPASPPNPGDVVQYGKPINRYAITMTAE